MSDPNKPAGGWYSIPQDEHGYLHDVPLETAVNIPPDDLLDSSSVGLPGPGPTPAVTPAQTMYGVPSSDATPSGYPLGPPNSSGSAAPHSPKPAWHASASSASNRGHVLVPPYQPPPPNSEERANPVSHLLYNFVAPLLFTGYGRPLTMEDVEPVGKWGQMHNVVPVFEKLWEEAYARDGKNVRLWTLIIRLVLKDMAAALACGAAYTASPFVVPAMMKFLIKYLRDPHNEVYPRWQGFGAAALILFCLSVGSLLLGRVQYFVLRASIRGRCALNAAIFTKTLKLSVDAWKQTSSGQVYNLIGQDTEQLFRMANIISMAMYIPLMTIVALGVLFGVMGVATFGGIAVLAVVLPLNYKITDSFLGFIKQRFIASDRRMKAMAGFLSGIRIVKFYAWEDAYISNILDLRRPEVAIVRNLMLQIAKLMVSQNFSPSLFMLVIFVLYCSYSTLDLIKIYTAISLVNIITQAFSVVPFLASVVLQAKASFIRIQAFMLLPELAPVPPPDVLDGAVRLRGVTSYWGPISDGSPVLTDVDFDAPAGSLIMVVGKVGSGKSSLVSTILRECNTIGTIHVGGSVAYVSQVAWILNASLRDNILFGQAYDEERYHNTFEAVDLAVDMDNLPNGDATEIGEKGINVSGGQKQRISIGRAVYNDADIVILDDPLSAVDVHVGKNIFERCIKGMLRHKTRILVTNQLQYLPHADVIYLVSDGRVTRETMHSERLREMLSVHDVNSKAAESQDTKTKQGDAPEKEEAPVSLDDEDENKKKKKPLSSGKLIQAEEKETGALSWWTYYSYLREFGSIPWFIVLITCTALMHAFLIVSQLWLGWWVSGQYFAGHRTVFYLVTFGILILISAILVCIREVMWAFGASRPPWRLHEKALRSVAGSPNSFFDTTPMGRIISRFTADLMELDFQLPLYFNQHISASFQLVAAIVVICIATWWFIPMIVVIVIVFFLVVKYYTRSSLELRRLFNMTKSPVFAHFSEALSGLSCIRAYGHGERFSRRFFELMDANNSAFVSERFGFEWMRLRCTQLSALVVGGAAFLVVGLHSQLSATVSALAMSQALLFTVVAGRATEMLAQTTMSMNCVERITRYCDLPQEETEEDRKRYQEPSPSWPDHGGVDFENVVMKYRDDTPLVLNGLTFSVRPGEKIGVVGRTGSGKSSTLLALYRMMTAAPGNGGIKIDGVDIASVTRKNLRSRLAIIPQDPVLFEGTIRSNLDPTKRHTDEECFAALKLCHLHDFLQSQETDAKGNKLENKLDFALTEGGRNMSVGQAQLVCLGRAVLRRHRILLMDEATASVDVTTDRLIQNTIREYFRDSTVITIAHRLHTVLDCDRVLVMDAGRVAEFGAPQELLRNPQGIFYGMVNKVRHGGDGAAH